MDGALVLVLIGWILSLMSKKNRKKSTRRAANAVKGNSAQHKASVAEKRYAELEKRIMVTREEKKPDVLQEIGEGESAVTYAGMGEKFRGSMQNESTEGECVCDPELEHVRPQVSDEDSVYSGEIGKEELIDFSVRGLIQGVVMSEILNRPVRHMRQR